MKKEIISLIGRTGAGKDQVATYFSHFGFGIYHADQNLHGAFKRNIKASGYPTHKQRDQQARYHMKKVSKMKDEKIVINWTFLQKSQRDICRYLFPDVIFLYIKTDPLVIAKRLEATPRLGHNISTEVALQMGKELEEPDAQEALVVENNGTLRELYYTLDRLLLPYDPYEVIPQSLL